MILYKKRLKYKYNLHSEVEYNTGIKVEKPADLGLLKITADGTLLIRKGYAWDGPSGPTIDTPNFMRGSLIHDALYQLMREEVLPQSARERADDILRQVCIKDKMSRFRAWYVYKAVRLWGASSARPDMLKAP